ncbi:hypothetical protein QF042_001737 [Pedobacter sp. W3I1]|uniref:DUF4062 domain-containing protein n=1 Tax=Pedobacter sp. W3I1 TaxID=3042291 RepID=UPI002787B1AB|nr:DUF4062 domain-containing protein [Pedobacter sp. W3I1]MDQ0638172.1 hypothetical protein [Pedobacter sp. W3I1]
MPVKKNTTRKTVFISSTFVDLKGERKKVWDSLENFDVTIKGMEQFGARKTTPLATCISEVEQSDIYVGIIGMRYGNEEPNTGKSYSQLEYEKAVEQNKEILIYLIDEENSNVTPTLIQFDKIQKLNNFKAILKAKHTIDTFSNPQDLITKLQRKFKELLTPKITAIIEDEYDNTKKVIDLFFLVPAAYSGREIKLKLKFVGNPQPVSKAICQSFNFEFGKTVVCKVEVVHPKFKFQNFRHIFIEFEPFQNFITLDLSHEYEIFAKVLFKDEKVKNLTTDFKDKLERIYNDRFNYDPSYDYDPSDDDEYYDVIKEGDGQIALNLTSISSKI